MLAVILVSDSSFGFVVTVFVHFHRTAWELGFSHQPRRTTHCVPFHCFRAPFDVSMTVLGVMVLVIIMTWPENYGDKTSNFKKSFMASITAIRTGMSQQLQQHLLYPWILVFAMLRRVPVICFSFSFLFSLWKSWWWCDGVGVWVWIRCRIFEVWSSF